MACLISNQLCGISCVHYCEGLRCCAMGTFIEGGNLVAKRGGVAWIVAPASSELSRTWYCRNDAATCAMTVSMCMGWFIPSQEELELVAGCRDFWDSPKGSSVFYKSNSLSYQGGFQAGWSVVLCCGKMYGNRQTCLVDCVRAVRKVYY